jgi:hypothetical protein
MLARVTVGDTTIAATRRRRLSANSAVARLLTATAAAALVSIAGPALGGVVDYPPVPPEQLADVIVVVSSQATVPLHVPTAAERIVHAAIVRVEKGTAPLVIVHTANTIVSPLRAGVPAKLLLKAFRNRNAHYIIGVYPESQGGHP